MLLALSGLVLTGVVFAVAPWLDLVVARALMNDRGAFIGATPIGEAVRAIGYQVPFWLLGASVLGWLLGKAGVRGRWPSGRAVLYLAVSLALGPGLLVNTVLKDHSHRPRPVQTEQLGGAWPFRPWHRFDGACVRNCSFVSGEASAAFWTLAPALLAPPPVRPWAVGASLAFGTIVAALRMAFGGHYLSDSLFAALLTILLVLALHRGLFPGKAHGRERPLRDVDAPL
jgi:membrane-associated phospholipid phosphatase